MALWFTLGIDGYRNINLVELKTKRIIKKNATQLDLIRIRKKYERTINRNK